MSWHATWPKVSAAGFLAGLVWSLSVYPWSGTWLIAILVACAALLWWRPTLWLFALPALLPIMDFAPTTGWFFLEEIDLLLMLIAAFAYWNLPTPSPSRFRSAVRSRPASLLQPASPSRPTSMSQPTTRSLSAHAPASLPWIELPRWPVLFGAGLILLATVSMIGVARALQSLPSLDANTFNNYLSSANGLRVAKGWAWTLVLLPPLRYAAGSQLQGLQQRLVPGTMLGLLLVTTAATRERLQFPGLLNFSSDYRISAPFSAMHTGGAALDGYLALTMPLLAVWLFQRHAPLRNMMALAILPLALYAGLATFSRGLYLALAVAIVILAIQAVRTRLGIILATGAAILISLDAAFRVGGYRIYGLALFLLSWLLISLNRRKLVAIMAGVLVLSAAVPIYHGYYVNTRFSTVNNDWSVRLRHWQQTLAMMNDNALTPLFGMGFGTFPMTYFWRNPQREVPPGYQYIDQGTNRHLRLAAGDYAAGYGELLRMLQAVQVQPRQQYVLGVDVWNGGVPAFLHVRLCQRQLLYPQSCVVVPLRQIPHALQWQRYLYTIDSGLLGSDRLPVKLELAVEGKQAVLDLDNVSLRTMQGNHELLRNGDFSEANNFWFFSSDRQHLPWHIKNLGLNLYFETGWLGVIAYALMLLSALASQLRRDDNAWFAALVAFQVVGLFDSLIDVPRITLLSTLILCAAALQKKSE